MEKGIILSASPAPPPTPYCKLAGVLHARYSEKIYMTPSESLAGSASKMNLSEKTEKYENIDNVFKPFYRKTIQKSCQIILFINVL
ncbi:MAG: hypothetical protein LBD67_08830 [Candidatus Accumulibacter sp.]|nr:hypothetical protein [Accumulibacter sp.]